MQILVIDIDARVRSQLVSRLQEALRRMGLKRAQMVEGDGDFSNSRLKEAPVAAFLGPGCYPKLEELITSFRAYLPTTPVAIVLDNDVYATEAVDLRRTIPLRIVPLADIAQMAQFILESESRAPGSAVSTNRGVVTVAQLKGGVGASTIAAGLAACWARHELSTVIIDLDDLNPQLTDWARVGTAQRKVVAELLRAGSVPSHRLDEMLSGVEGFDGGLAVIGQPENYSEAFHFRADVLDRAPSSADFINALIPVLQEEFDVIVIDAGRSWGVSCFASLILSQHVLLITDDDGMSLRRTVDNLLRLYRESEDPAEFDLAKWKIIFNAYTQRLLTPNDVTTEIEELEIFPDTTSLFTIPFSERGRQWGAPGESFYDAAEDHIKEILRDLAFNLIPFRLADKASGVKKIRNGWRRLTK